MRKRLTDCVCKCVTFRRGFKDVIWDLALLAKRPESASDVESLFLSGGTTTSVSVCDVIGELPQITSCAFPSVPPYLSSILCNIIIINNVL